MDVVDFDGAAALLGFTWRIIPVSKWLITMVSFKSPSWGYSISKWPISWLTGSPCP